MNSFQRLDQVAHLEELKLTIGNSSPRAVLYRWAETAGELQPSKRQAIQNIRSIYAEMSDQELNLSRLLMFLEAILGELPEKDNRRSLISIEACSALKK